MGALYSVLSGFTVKQLKNDDVLCWNILNSRVNSNTELWINESLFSVMNRHELSWIHIQDDVRDDATEFMVMMTGENTKAIFFWNSHLNLQLPIHPSFICCNSIFKTVGSKSELFLLRLLTTQECFGRSILYFTFKYRNSISVLCF